MGKVTEASALRIVTSAELKRLSGSRPKMGREAGAGDLNGHPTHVESSPVYRGTLRPFGGTPGGTWSAGMILGAKAPSRLTVRKAERLCREKMQEEAKAIL